MLPLTYHCGRTRLGNTLDSAIECFVMVDSVGVWCVRVCLRFVLLCCYCPLGSIYSHWCRKYGVKLELSENTPSYWNYGLGLTLALSSHCGLVGYCGPTSLFWS